MTSFLPILVCCFAAQSGPLDDPRLAAPVTLVAPAETVEKVLAEVGRQCGVTLEASGAIEEDLVIVAVKDVSAAQFLSRLASHFGWQWTKAGSTLRLERSAEAAKNEDRLADEARLRPFVEIQRRLRETPVELSPEERARIEAELEAVRKKMTKLAEAEDDESWREYDRLSTLHSLLFRKLDPGLKLVEQVVRDLSAEQLRGLVTRGRLVLSTKPTSAQFRMSAKAARFAAEHVKQAAQDGVDQLKAFEAEGALKAQDRENFFTSPQFATAVRVTLQAVERTGPAFAEWTENFSGISVDVAILGDPGEVLTSHGNWVDRSSASFSPADAPPTGLETPAPFAVFEDARFQVSIDGNAGLKAQLIPFAFPDDDFTAVVGILGYIAGLVRDARDPLYPIAQILTESAAASGSNLIADGYDSNIIRCVSRRLSGRLRDVKSVLTAACRAAGWSPSLKENWLMLRTRDWALARRSTVPRGSLRELADLHQRQSGFSMDQVAGLVARMTDEQATSPLLELTLIESWPITTENVCLVRAYAGLGIVQKELLGRGDPISFATIAPGPRALLGEHLFRTGTMQPPEAAPSTDEARLQQYQLEVESLGGRHRDWEVTQILPGGPTAATVLRLGVKSEPGIAFRVSIGGNTLQAGLTIQEFAEVSMSMAEESELPFEFRIEAVRAGTTDSWDFAIVHPDLFSSPTSFRQIYCSPLAAFGPTDALPEGHRARLAAAVQKIKERRGGGGGTAASARTSAEAHLLFGVATP